MSTDKQHIPVMRHVTIIEGARTNTSPQGGMLFITDLAGARPPKGKRAYLSPHRDLRLLLRGVKTIKDKHGRVMSEKDPIEVMFNDGKLIVDEVDKDEEDGVNPAVGLLDAHPGRGSTFYTYDDVMGMKDIADEKTMESFLSSASEEVIAKLKVKLGAKGFDLPAKEAGGRRGKPAA